MHHLNRWLRSSPVLVALFVGRVLAADIQPSAIVGAWRLVSSETRAEDGTIEPTLGEAPIGMLMYDSAGRMSVHLMRRDRPKFASNDMRRGVPEEIKVAFEGHVSYFGTYSLQVADGTVSHHLEGSSFPNWIGTTQKRFLTLSGKRLSLSTPPMQVSGKTVRVFLVWERLD